MRAQLDRLLAVSGLDTVELRIIPFTAELPMTTSHGSWIFDDRLVLVETVSSEISLRDSDDIALYQRHFEALWRVARHVEESRELIAAAVDLLETPPARSS